MMKKLSVRKIAKLFFKIILASVVVLGVAVFFIFQLPSFGGSFSGERLERMKKSPEYQDGRFENNPKQITDLSYSSLKKTYDLYQQGIAREPQLIIPVISIDPTSLKRPPVAGLNANWFGHSSVLAEIDGVRMITDPVLSERVSPLKSVGPKRFHSPPISLDSLAGIDFVVISHDHYDHLDMETVKHLATQGTHFFVGLGVGAHFEKWNIPKDQVHEMDWWDEATFKGLKIICTPARHYSGRKRQDNSTLWASWVVKGPEHSIYFSGDSGYADHFKEIRKKFGSVDMTFMKVGAYGDTWLDIHMDPEEAVQAHIDLAAKVMLPVHWATFDLSYHAWDEPMIRTLQAALAKNVEVITPRIGERYEYGKPFSSLSWYRSYQTKTQ